MQEVASGAALPPAPLGLILEELQRAAADFSVSPASFSIPNGGAAQTVYVGCTPSAPGLRTATLTVEHNAADSPATYPLTCTGKSRLYLPLVMK